MADSVEALSPFSDNHEWLTSSPSSSASSPELLATPYIDVNLLDVTEPFSRSFSGLIDIYADSSFLFEDDAGQVSLRREALEDHSKPFWKPEAMKEKVEAGGRWEVNDLSPTLSGPETQQGSAVSPTNCASPSDKTPAIRDFQPVMGLGEGGAAAVVLARRRQCGTLYAVKQTPKDVDGPVAHARAETLVLNTLSTLRAPFLPRLHWSFEDERHIHFVLDYYPGGDLLTHLTRVGRFSLERTRFYACELIQALSVLHTAGIVHRDIKPENVLIDADGHIVLADFGCAKVLARADAGQRQRALTSCGTPEYQAPEIVLGWAHDFTVDIWGFGMLLYLMLFGKHPFIADKTMSNLADLHSRILSRPSVSLIDCNVDAHAQHLVALCLEPNPEQRAVIHDIKTHAFFSDIDWDLVVSKMYPVPWQPQSSVPLVDFRYFDSPPLLVTSSLPQDMAKKPAIHQSSRQDVAPGIALQIVTYTEDALSIKDNTRRSQSSSLPNVTLQAATLLRHARTSIHSPKGTSQFAGDVTLFKDLSASTNIPSQFTPPRLSRAPQTASFNDQSLSFQGALATAPYIPAQTSSKRRVCSSRLSPLRKFKRKHRRSIVMHSRPGSFMLPLHVKVKGKGIGYTAPRRKHLSSIRRAFLSLGSLLSGRARSSKKWAKRMSSAHIRASTIFTEEDSGHDEEGEDVETVLSQMKAVMQSRRATGPAPSPSTSPSLAQDSTTHSHRSSDPRFVGAVDGLLNPAASSVRLVIVSPSANRLSTWSDREYVFT